MLTSGTFYRLYVCAELLQSCLTLCNPVDCCLPGPLSMGFSRKEYWSGLLGDPGIEPMSFMSSPLTDLVSPLTELASSLPLAPPGKPFIGYTSYQLYQVVTQMLYMHFRL